MQQKKSKNQVKYIVSKLKKCSNWRDPICLC